MTKAKPKPQAVAAALGGQVGKILVLKAHAEIEREKADDRARKILASRVWVGLDGNQVTEPQNSWLIGKDLDEYHRLCDESRAAAGYKLEPGYCPALIAEDELRIAERELVALAEPFFGVKFDDLFTKGDGIASYRKYVDLLIRLTVSASKI